MLASTRTNTCARKHAHTLTRTRTHANTRTHTHTHTHTHTPTHTQVMDQGFDIFFYVDMILNLSTATPNAMDRLQLDRKVSSSMVH